MAKKTNGTSNKTQNSAPKSYLIDMDGVIISGKELIPGADEFIERLKKRNAKFLILTNNSEYTPVDLQHRLQTMGVEIPENRFYTSAMAAARFISSQRPEGTAFVIGESGLTEALHEVGYVLTDHDPDYVVLGETTNYSFARLTTAIRLVACGARFIATNPDVSGPGVGGLVPACGAVAALIEKATGVQPFYVGKPNPLMMRTALQYLDEHSENTIMVGDRMDTDIVAGIESGLGTILVLSGVTSPEDVEKYPYRPHRVLNSVAEIVV